MADYFFIFQKIARTSIDVIAGAQCNVFACIEHQIRSGHARHGAVLCKSRTPDASSRSQMQTETDKRCEHMKRTIRPFQDVAEYFVICGEIEGDIRDASQRPRRSV